MCINCNLITPVTDEFAEYLGVEKKKYLVQGCTTVPFIDKLKGQPWSNSLYNYKTIDFFAVYPVKNIDVKKDGTTVRLYEGKINVIGPLPNKCKYSGWDDYIELFDKEIIWEDDPEIPPSQPNQLSQLANKYSNKKE